MGLVIQRGSEPGEFGIYVQDYFNYTFSRADALMQAVLNFAPDSALHIQAKSIVAGPAVASRPGPSEFEEVETGCLRVSLVEGGNSTDLVNLLRGALEDGTVGPDWIVQVGPSGEELTLTDPGVHLGDPELNRTVGFTDYPMRDRQYHRPEGRGPKRTKVTRPRNGHRQRKG